MADTASWATLRWVCAATEAYRLRLIARIELGQEAKTSATAQGIRTLRTSPKCQKRSSTKVRFAPDPDVGAPLDRLGTNACRERYVDVKYSSLSSPPAYR